MFALGSLAATENQCLFLHVFSLDSSEEQRDEILKLKRRFIKDKSVTSNFYARYGARKKARKEVSVC